MPTAIHPDTAAALKAWDKGDPVRSVYLGHTQKHIPGVEGHPDRIDFNTPPHRNRQDLAHAWCFSIIEYFMIVGAPHNHEEFETIVDELANTEAGRNDLTPEERAGAESLAWKALIVGWDAAIDGLPATRYLQVQKPAIEAT
jgi:hypothetical protein